MVNFQVVSILAARGRCERASIDEVYLDDQELFIPNWDLSILTIEKMDILGELWKKRVRK